MNSARLLTFALLAVSAAGLGSLGAQQPADLVKQLGADEFEVRQRARQALLELGPAAEAALRRGLGDPDVEVKARCKELLDTIATAQREARLGALLAGKGPKEPLAGWARFAAAAGEDAAARQAFVKVYRAAGAALEDAARAPREAAADLNARCAGLKVRMILPGGDESALTEVGVVLLLASDPAVPLDAPSARLLLDGLQTLAARPALVKSLQESAATSKFLTAFLAQDRAGELERRLGVARDLGLRDAIDWAAKLAADPKAPPGVRAQGLLLLGQVGGREVLPRLTPLLTDTTPVGTRALGKVTLTAQLRDVALAAVIRVNGLDPGDFGFPYPAAVPGLKTVPAPACLGFADEVGRKATFAKWAARPAKP